MFRFLSTALDQLLWSLFFPDCPVCGFASKCGGLCDHCQVISPIQQSVCLYCGALAVGSDCLCFNCVQINDRMPDEIHSMFWLNDEARKLFHMIKYGGRFEWLNIFLSVLKEAKIHECFKGATLVPVPIHPRKFLERGFNQSELLAGVLSKTWGMKISDGLMKITETLPQSHLNKKERLLNLKDCFVWDSKKNVPNKVVLIDDIVTTGETLKRCGATVKALGTSHVYAWTLFRTSLS